MGCRDDIGPVPNQDNKFRRIGAVVIQARNVSRRIGQQRRIRILLQVFRKFSVTLLAITLSEAELLHARELPRFRVPVSIKNGGVNVTIRRFGCWGEHIPPLEKSSPLEIRTDRASKRSDQRRIQRDAPADDRNYVKEQKRADRDTLHTAQIPPFQKGVTNGRGASCI